MSKSYDSKLMSMSGGEYTKAMRIANLAKARLARGKKKSTVKNDVEEVKEVEEPKEKVKGVYTKEMRIANLAKARLARGKKKTVGKGITSTAMTADQTAEGKGYYTQDYVPSNQLNFQGTPLDNMDYSKIRARKEDKRKKGEYSYSKPMADNDMPIPTVSGNGMKKRKNMKKMLKHHKRTYEEELVSDGYMPTMAQTPEQYASLMNGSGWNDFVRAVRSVESGLSTGLDLFNRGAQAYNAIQRATPSSMPMGRTGRNETPNSDYTQTSGLYEPINEGWEMVGQPLSDRPNRRTSSIASREPIAPSYDSMAYSDRPNRRTTSNIPVERINPRSNAYEDFDVLPRYEAPRQAPRQQPTAPPYDFLEEQARELERYNRAKPATRQKPTAPPYDFLEEQARELDRIDRTRATDRPNMVRRRFENRDALIQYTDRPHRPNEDRSAWAEAEETLRRGRIAPHDIYYQPSDLDLRDLDKYDPVGYTSKPQKPVGIDRELLLDAKRRKERAINAEKQLALTKAETNRLKRQTDFDTTYTNAVNSISDKETKKHNNEMARLRAETEKLNKMSAFDKEYNRKMAIQNKSKAIIRPKQLQLESKRSELADLRRKKELLRIKEKASKLKANRMERESNEALDKRISKVVKPKVNVEEHASRLEKRLEEAREKKTRGRPRKQ